MIISCFMQPYLIDERASSNKCYNIRFLCFSVTRWSYRAIFLWEAERNIACIKN